MKYSYLLLILSKIKGDELELDEMLNELKSTNSDSNEYSTLLTNWIFKELNHLNHYREFALELESNIVNVIASIGKNSKTLEQIENEIIKSNSEEVNDLILNELHIKIVNLSNEGLYNFYNSKINQIKINPTEIRRNLFHKIQLIEKKEDKVIFNEFFEYLKDFQPHPLPLKESEIGESTSKTPKDLKWHPFHNNDVRDFHLYLESKYPNEINNTKSVFSAFWKFFEKEGLIDLNEKNRIMNNYIDWINKRFEFQDEELITKLQTNTESFPLSAFEKHYDEFEESKGDNFRFYDFRDGAIQRTKKKRPTK